MSDASRNQMWREVVDGGRSSAGGTAKGKVILARGSDPGNKPLQAPNLVIRGN